MATYKTLGDVIIAIQGRSTAGITYTVAASTFFPGAYDVIRNGARTWSFIFPPVPGGGPWTGAATDVNPTGAELTVISPDNVTGKADVAQFINSLT